jgi:hypothetical protein
MSLDQWFSAKGVFLIHRGYLVVYRDILAVTLGRMLKGITAT